MRAYCLAILAALVVLPACNCGAEISKGNCVDTDGDGADTCSNDCNDGDPSVFPGAPEACDGKDNNCDGRVDEGCAGGLDAGTGKDAGPDFCRPGDAPKSCGTPGSTCQRACGTDGMLGACQPSTGPTDFKTDVKNCGVCGLVCPAPLHAAAKCVAGQCVRGPCDPGFFDFDGLKTFGCEVSCVGKTCKDAAGNPIPVDNAPLPESGQVFQAFASGASYGGFVQTSPKYTNFGVLGESTPPVSGGQVEMKGAGHVHRGGLLALPPK